MTASPTQHYILGMISYLSSGMSQNSCTIKQELIRACATSERDPDVTAALAHFGDADCLHAYANKHGTSAFRVLRDSGVNHSIRSPIVVVSVKTAEHFVRCVEILKPAILSSTSLEKAAAELLEKAKRYDCPELIQPSFDVLEITPEHVRGRFFLNSHTFNMKPRFAQWMADFMAREIVPEKTGTDGFGEHIDRLMRKGDPHGIAAYIRLGYDVRVGFDYGLIHSHGNEWFNRFARRLETAHDHIEMLARLPELQEILTMDKTALTHLIAGKSNKEMRREAGVKKKLAQEAQAKENSTP